MTNLRLRRKPLMMKMKKNHQKTPMMKQIAQPSPAQLAVLTEDDEDDDDEEEDSLENDDNGRIDDHANPFVHPHTLIGGIK
eukprot:jgi/Psemu1/55551/gm1.55551_g